MADKQIYTIERVLQRLRLPNAGAKLGRRQLRKLAKAEWEGKDNRLSPSTRNQPSRQPTDHLVPLLSTVHHLSQLEQSMLRALEPHLRDECRLAKYANGEMVLFCRTSALASYLRYHQREYIQRLKKLPEYGELRSIKVRLMMK